MKKKLFLAALFLVSGVFFLCTVQPAQAYLLNGFSYGGTDYGTLEITAGTGSSNRNLNFTFSMNTGLPGDARLVGLAFNFDAIGSSTVVGNPSNGAYPDDINGVRWLRLTDLASLATPSNSSTVSAGDFNYAVQASPSTGWTMEGSLDRFLITAFPSAIVLGDYGTGFVNLVGIVVAGLPPTVNGGSLFLVPVSAASPVPEPATMVLLGCGLVGLAGFGRKKILKKS